LRELDKVFLHIADLAVLNHDAVSRSDGQAACGVDFCVLDCLVDASFIRGLPGEEAATPKSMKKARTDPSLFLLF